MAEKVKDLPGGMAEYQVTVSYKDEAGKQQSKTGGNGKEGGTFVAPGAWGIFKAFIAKLDDKATEAAYDFFLYATDLKQRAMLRPAVAAETPVVMRDGLKINLATGEIHDKDGALKRTLTLAQRTKAVNGAFEEASAMGTEPSSRVVTARRMLLESGAVVEKNGELATK